jgi:hypothetical protein
MKTEQLISLLAQGAGPAPQQHVLRRLAPGAALGPRVLRVLRVLRW